MRKAILVHAILSAAGHVIAQDVVARVSFDVPTRVSSLEWADDHVYTGLQSIVDRVATLGGGLVILEPKAPTAEVFFQHVDPAVSIPNGVTLDGGGSGDKALLVSRPNSAATPGIRFSPLLTISGGGVKMNAHIINVDLRAGDAATAPSFVELIQIDGCGAGSDVTVESCDVTCMLKGVATVVSHGVVVYDCLVLVNAPSTALQALIASLPAGAVGGFGVYFRGCQSCWLTNSRVSGPGYWANLAPSITEPFRTNVACLGSFPPCDLVSLSGGVGNVITANEVTYGNAAGVFVFDDGPTRGNGNMITFNTVSYTRQHGLDLGFQDDMLVAGNFVSHNETAGISLADCASAIVAGNAVPTSNDTVAPCNVPEQFSGAIFILWGSHGCLVAQNVVGGGTGVGAGPARAILFHQYPGFANAYSNYIGSPSPGFLENHLFAGYSTASPYVHDPGNLNIIGLNFLY
jgi:hypothetical protein